MRKRSRILMLSVSLIAFVLLQVSPIYSQGQGPKIPKQLPKQINKEGRKLAGKAEQAAERIGRDAVFCLLAALTDVGTAAELKATFEAHPDVTFGDFVVSVALAELAEISLDDVLAKVEMGVPFGDIAKEAGLDIEELGDIHRGFADIRGDVIQLFTHPPTIDCFKSTE